MRSRSAFASKASEVGAAWERPWNSETLRTAYLLVGKEMARHDPKSRAFSVCFAAYQQIEATDANLGTLR